jgi:hypothetical protein
MTDRDGFLTVVEHVLTTGWSFSDDEAHDLAVELWAAFKSDEGDE